MFSDKEHNDKIRVMTFMALEMVAPEHRRIWAAKVMIVAEEEVDENTIRQAKERLKQHPEPYALFDGLHAIATGKQFIGFAGI